MHICK